MDISPNCGLKWYENSHKGILFNVSHSPNSASCGVKTMRMNSFQVQGPLLFNTLPRELRDSTVSNDTWKCKLDKYLEYLPDRPITTDMDSGLCDPHTAKPTNSILVWTPYIIREGFKYSEVVNNDKSFPQKEPD